MWWTGNRMSAWWMYGSANEFGYELINCLNGMGVKSNYIMMSGYDDFQYACEALRCGAVDYLLKAP